MCVVQDSTRSRICTHMYDTYTWERGGIPVRNVVQSSDGKDFWIVTSTPSIRERSLTPVASVLPHLSTRNMWRNTNWHTVQRNCSAQNVARLSRAGLGLRTTGVCTSQRVTTSAWPVHTSPWLGMSYCSTSEILATPRGCSHLQGLTLISLSHYWVWNICVQPRARGSCGAKPRASNTFFPGGEREICYFLLFITCVTATCRRTEDLVREVVRRRSLARSRSSVTRTSSSTWLRGSATRRLVRWGHII